VQTARAEGRIQGWFFLRYVEAGRDHLRVRVRADVPAQAQLFAALSEALEPARQAGELASVEIAPYFREHARYGEDAMDAVEQLFELDSALACEQLLEGDPLEETVCALDALAAGLGLSLFERRELARRRRAAHAAELEPIAEELSARFRAGQARLHERLRVPPAGFCERVERAVADLSPARRQALLPPLLHLASVRRQGPGPVEAEAYYFWERALDGLIARSRRDR
jgi:thiopeptide-type bacteriocin biosynthesis protein